MSQYSGYEAIKQAFGLARAEGRAALIPFFTAGYPTLSVLADLIRAAEEAGADLVEIGIPFSDPLADGPVLQRAAGEALAAGVTIDQIFSALSRLPVGAPRIFLTYVNPVLRRGYAGFAHQAADVGMAGAVVPDLPWVESGALSREFDKRQLALVPLVAPTSTSQHLRDISTSKGFIYGVSVTGVTGSRSGIDVGVTNMVQRIKTMTDLPVAIGFGISTPEHARAIGDIADGVIVGSALTEAMMAEQGNLAKTAYEFLRPMRKALDHV